LLKTAYGSALLPALTYYCTITVTIHPFEGKVTSQNCGCFTI